MAIAHGHAPSPAAAAKPPPAGMLRLLADDLTGALDSAACLAGPGGVPVWLRPPAGPDTSAAAAGIADSRHLATEQLGACLTPWRSWLAGGALAFKKVDSLLRGATLDELAWWARGGEYGQLILAPAFPAQGRLTHGLQQWLQDGQGKETPVGPGRLDQAFARLDVDAGADARHTVWIPEVRSDADLDRLTERLTEQVTERLRQPQPAGCHTLWCGSAGLAGAIARRLGAGQDPMQPRPAVGCVTVVTATRHPVLRAQWQVLQQVAEPRVTLIDLSPAEPLPAPAALAAVRRNAQRWLATAPRPEALVVIGGDGLLALLDASQTDSLLAHRAPRPGWGYARWQGGRWPDLPCWSRSGAFGDTHDLRVLVAHLLAPA